jgi:hypothetical protein
MKFIFSICEFFLSIIRRKPFFNISLLSSIRGNRVPTPHEQWSRHFDGRYRRP